MAAIVLLGPQRLSPILDRVIADLGIQGRIATITAGWQEREAEDDELADHLSGRTVNLRLYARAEEVFDADAELAAAYRERQDLLKRAQELYRLRLDHAMAAVRELNQREAELELLEDEQRAAFEAVRRLDDGHLTRVLRVHADFERTWSPLERPAVRKQCESIQKILAGCDGLAVAGGHVAVLLNRLRLFAVDRLVGDRPVLAWSAGAMALGRRVVLFHDSPPQGFGNAEVMESGLGLYSGILPMPHARRRLQLADSLRVSELARRFAPGLCVPMDGGECLRIDGDEITAEAPLRSLTAAGRVVRFGAVHPGRSGRVAPK